MAFRPMRLIPPACAGCLALAVALDARARDAFLAAESVPHYVDFFLAVDDAAGWRAGPGGRFLASVVPALVRASELADAWSALAETLGMDADHAFDELLGRRVVFLRADSDKQPAWAILSLVSRRTEQRIRASLKPAPRTVEKGQPVLSIEDGRYWIASAPAWTGTVLLLAPASSPALFNDLLATLGRPAKDSLASSKLGEDLRVLQPGSDAMVMARWRADDGRLVLVAAAARRQGRRVEIASLLRSELLAERLASVQPTPRRPADDLADGALFAVIDWRLPGIIEGLGGPDLRFPLPPMLRAFEARDLLAPRRALVFRPDADGRLTLTLAYETIDAERLSAPADRLMASILTSLWASPQLDVRFETFDFTGQFPDAIRQAPLPPAVVALAPAMFGESPGIAWVYRRDHAPENAARGWWVIGLSAEEARRAADILAGDRDGRDAPTPWVNLGAARPAELVRALERARLPLPPAAAHLTRPLLLVESVDWIFSRSDGGSLRGRASVAFVPHHP